MKLRGLINSKRQAKFPRENSIQTFVPSNVQKYEKH
jgi:hypothetical protein